MLQAAVPTAEPRSPSLFARKYNIKEPRRCRQPAFVQARACWWWVSEHISLQKHVTPGAILPRLLERARAALWPVGAALPRAVLPPSLTPNSAPGFWRRFPRTERIVASARSGRTGWVKKRRPWGCAQVGFAISPC